MSKISKTQREALIWELMDGFPGSHSNITAGVINAYVEATSDCSDEAITRSVDQYRSGRVEEHRGNYAPSSADFARNVRTWDQALAVLAGMEKQERLVRYPLGELPPPCFVPLGPIKVDFGEGPIDMRGMSHDEKEAIMQNKGLHPQVGKSDKLPALKARRM